MLFWVMIACLATLLATGFAIWQPYFAPAFSITVVRIAVLLHALAAFGLILGIIVHIYAAIWVKGTVRAMTRGYVSRTWARKHHRAWHRQVTSGNGPE
jgi:formate dehydrogenase subunit gamma